MLNSLSFAVATVLIAGVNLFAMALVIRLLLGWPIPISIVLAAGIVLVYITLGGLSSAIYNEVLQFFVILAGLVPLTIVGLKAVGGWSGLQEQNLLPYWLTRFEDHELGRVQPVAEAAKLVRGYGERGDPLALRHCVRNRRP